LQRKQWDQSGARGYRTGHRAYRTGSRSDGNGGGIERIEGEVMEERNIEGKKSLQTLDFIALCNPSIADEV